MVKSFDKNQNMSILIRINRNFQKRLKSEYLCKYSILLNWYTLEEFLLKGNRRIAIIAPPIEHTVNVIRQGKQSYAQ